MTTCRRIVLSSYSASSTLYCDKLQYLISLHLLSLAASSTTYSAYGGTSPASTLSRSKKYWTLASGDRSNGSSPFPSATPGKEVLKPTIP